MRDDSAVVDRETQTLTDVFGPVMDLYTRANALEDGQLIDVSATASEAGFRLPVAMTVAAWLDAVKWDGEDNKKQGTAQDQIGRLWDVLTMARWAAQGQQAGRRRISFHVLRVPRDGRSSVPQILTLLLCIGPGDQRQAVLTITCVNED